MSAAAGMPGSGDYIYCNFENVNFYFYTLIFITDCVELPGASFWTIFRSQGSFFWQSYDGNSSNSLNYEKAARSDLRLVRCARACALLRTHACYTSAAVLGMIRHLVYRGVALGRQGVSAV